MTDSIEGLDLSQLTRELMDKVGRELVQMKIRAGTVVAYSPGNDSATVHLDGDPNDNAVEVTNVTGIFLTAGTRILVMFSPPQGGYIIGNTGAVMPMGRMYWSIKPPPCS